MGFTFAPSTADADDTLSALSALGAVSDERAPVGGRAELGMIWRRLSHRRWPQTQQRLTTARARLT